MKKFITERVQVLLPAGKPGLRSDESCNGGAAASRYALMALLALGLFGGISQAQDPLKIDATGVHINATESIEPSKGPAVLQMAPKDYPGELRLQYKLEGDKHRIGFANSDGTDWLLWSEYGGAAYIKGPVGVGKTPDANAKLDVAGNANFSGNVGVGTATPKAPLQIGDDSLFQQDARIRLSSSAGPGKAGRVWSVGVKYGGDDVTSSNYGFTIRDENASTNRMVIASETGNVGIGTDPTTNKFSVSGTGYFSGNVGIGKPDPNAKLDVAGNILIDGVVAGAAHVAINAYIDKDKHWQIKDKTKKAAAIALLDSGAVKFYATQTAGEADWQEIGAFGKRLVLQIGYGGKLDVTESIRSSCAAPEDPNLDAGCSFKMLVRYSDGKVRVAAGTIYLANDGKSGATAQDASHAWWELSNNNSSHVVDVLDNRCRVKVQNSRLVAECNPDGQATLFISSVVVK